MRAAIHINNADHQRANAEAMKAGLRRHGVECAVGAWDRPEPCDFAVVWGVRQARIMSCGRPVLVMERGHLPDRMVYSSVGWGGLGRRGLYAKATDAGARWDRLFSSLMQPWRTGGDRVLVFGQVRGDAAIEGVDFEAWATKAVAAAINAYDLPAVYRPHPESVKRGDLWCPKGALFSSSSSLADDMERARVAICFNSTAGVEAALAGVPIVALDEGAMVYDVAGHVIGEIVVPFREPWAHDLAWTSWSLAEMSSGEAWEAVRSVGPFAN